jgi:acyl-CoA hydrolase
MNTGTPSAQSIDRRLLHTLVAPDDLVYIPGSSGAPSAFMDSLLSEPVFTRGLHILTSFVPGINALDFGQLHPSARVTGLFMQPSFSGAQRDGRFRALPMSYGAFVGHLREHIDIDLAVVQVSPPDENGLCSLGPAVEFMPVALTKSRRRIGLINANTPRLANSSRVPYDSFDFVCEVDTPLPTYATVADETTRVIARHVATLVADGCVLQLGLGKLPTALSHLLIDRRGLRFHSGMLSDGFLELAECGALDPDFMHTACVAVGSKELYSALGRYPALRLAGCEFTHDSIVLAQYRRFVAVNSALEVDLFGQCNLEHAAAGAVSGVGGAPDFARAARLSVGGRSVVALNARHKSGSRIVSTLSPPSVASLTRYDVDHVVTEFGVADLIDASVHERAQALIGIAAPEFRANLSEQWQAIAARL